MHDTLQKLGIDQMTVNERILLVQAILDSVIADQAASDLTVAQRTELERRLADSLAHPDAGTPWDDVKAELRSRVRT